MALSKSSEPGKDLLQDPEIRRLLEHPEHQGLELKHSRQVYTTRKALGRRLAEESPVEADVVIPVPDSGVAAALGFAEKSGMRY